jgi:hypothetical protein
MVIDPTHKLVNLSEREIDLLEEILLKNISHTREQLRASIDLEIPALIEAEDKLLTELTSLLSKVVLNG